MTDAQVRLAAFEFLKRQNLLRGDVLSRSLLEDGFEFEGRRVPLVGPPGIFKPQILREGMPLSITTAPEDPYEDGLEQEGIVSYRYRGKDPNHHENVGLRRAMSEMTPLIYFRGLVPGRYLSTYPAYVVGDDPSRLTFRVQVDDRIILPSGEGVSEAAPEARRAYVTVTIQRRIHQQSFRERVLLAYRRECSLCRLRHEGLLDAAHIIPDCDTRGVPEVWNGIAMCRLHHGAYDADLIGIRPDHVVEVRRSILDEPDGPMLEHGLKAFHEQRIRVPRSDSYKPKREFLEERYEQFRQAC